MAMISIKNLVAPVSNTVHLATIGFVVLGFAVWRWSGGEINFVRGNRPQNQAAYERAGAASILDRTPPEAKLIERKRQAPPTQESNEVEISEGAAEDLLGSILNKKAAEPSVEKRNDSTKRRSASSLEDIERSLGINKK